MSKAFVIKNKQDNRYLVVYNFYGDENYKLGELYDATLFSNLELANETKTRVEPYNCNHFELEVVEITIAEGDLEHKIAVLEKALELACIELCYDGNITDLSYREEYYIQQAEKELKGGEV